MVRTIRHWTKRLWVHTVPGYIVVGCISTTIVGCTPKVDVAFSDKPIEININAKISHEVNVTVERDIQDLVRNNRELF